MTYNEFYKWLKNQGVKISKVGGRRHYMKGTLNGVTVPLPYHGTKEISEGTKKKIIKELGI